MTTIAFLGLGVMGSAMAANLARSGHSVKAWNRTPGRAGIAIAAEAGATIVESIAAAVVDAEVIVSCVSAAADVEAVLFEAVVHAPAGAIAIDTSTIGPEAARRIGQQLAEHGLRFLDAPVSGGDVGAQQGTLTFMVGGDRADFEACCPLFAAMGQHIHHCGAVGSGQALKLCNQILCVANLMGVCEALQLAEQLGIHPQQVIDVCSGGAAGSWMLNNLGAKVTDSDFEPGFMINHMLKDLGLVEASANATGVNLPGTMLVNHLLHQVQTLGGGQQGTQALIRAYRE